MVDFWFLACIGGGCKCHHCELASTEPSQLPVLLALKFFEEKLASGALELTKKA